jgi:hypothetical protein
MNPIRSQLPLVYALPHKTSSQNKYANPKLIPTKSTAWNPDYSFQNERRAKTPIRIGSNQIGKPTSPKTKYQRFETPGSYIRKTGRQEAHRSQFTQCYDSQPSSLKKQSHMRHVSINVDEIEAFSIIVNRPEAYV